MIKSSAIVVVLDNTNVVNETLIDSVYLILNRFICDSGQSDYLGFVRFDNKQVVITHKIEHSKSILKNKFDKCDLDNDYYSDLEYGLSSGLQLFEECGFQFDQSILILITSNTNNKPNFINVAEKIRENKINFNCIAIGPRADDNLERIVELTHGKLYSSDCSDRRDFTRVFENCILNAMFNENQIITILDENIELQNEPLEHKFNMDGKFDNQLICTISINDTLPDDSDFKFELFDPDNGKIDDPGFDPDLKRIQFIPSKCIPGQWTLKSTNKSRTGLRINISIRYKLKDNKSIALRAQLKQVNLKYQYPPLIIVELTNGLEQFKASNIKAIIKRPDGSEFEMNLNEFNKLYSKCFEDLNGPGRYNVSIKAENVITSEKCKFFFRLRRALNLILI